jgi:hypothetical protein
VLGDAMPDPVFLLELMAGAAVLAAAMVLAWGWPWRAAIPARIALGEALGVGIAFFLGFGLLGRWPRWPLLEAEDRLVAIVLPAVLIVEVVAALLPPASRWLAWFLRLGMAASVAPVLLHSSQYLTDAAGPGTRLWATGQAILWLGGLAVALGLVWLGLVVLARRGSGRASTVALAVVCAGAAPTIMVSGYATGGPPLLPVAGALVGTAAASLLLPLPRGASAAIGVGVVLLFGLLVIGRFFGELHTVYAGMLLFAPLLMWLLEFLPGKKQRPWRRAVLGVAVVTIPVGIAFYLAQKPNAGSDAAPGTSGEPSTDDYQQFGR